MNRFVNLSTSQFDPLNWEEVARVPLAKRAAHTAQQQAMAQLETNIANIDPLDVHKDEAKSIQENYINQIDSLSSKLAEEGIGGFNTQSILDLNSQYKKDFSPTGRAGRINSSKLKYNEAKKNFYDSGIKNGWSKEDLDRNWKKHTSSYTGYSGDNNENVEFIGDLGSPLHFDIKKDVFDTASKIGETAGVNINRIGVKSTPEGIIFLDKQTGTRLTNSSQLEALTKAMLGDYTNPNTDRGKFANFSELSSKDIADLLNQYIPTMSVDKQTLNRSNQVLSNPYSGSKSSSTKALSGGNIYSGLGSSRSYFGQAETTDQVEQQIINLAASGDDAKAREVQSTYDRIIRDYNEQPASAAYINSTKSLEEKIKPLQGIETPGVIGNGQAHIFTNNFTAEDLIEASSYINSGGPTLGRDTFIQERVDKNGNKTYDLIKNGTSGINIPFELVQEARNLSQRREKYLEGKNKQIQHYNKQNVEFSLTDLKSADRTTLNKDLSNTIKSFGTNEFKVTDGLVIDNESNKSENLFGMDRPGIWTGDYFDKNHNKEDQKAIMNLLKNSDTKIEFLSYTSQNHTGLPAVKVQVTPGGDNEFANKTLQLTLDLNNIQTNNPSTGQLMTSVNSADNLILDKFAALGGPEGKALAKRGKQRIRYQDIKPTFTSDYSISDNIKKQINNPYVSEIIKDKDVDINLVGDKYVVDIASKDGTQAGTLGWSSMINTTSSETTKNDLQKLSPILASKLVEDVKNLYPQATSLDELTEQQVDDAIKYLAEQNVSISTNNYYDLMDILSNYR